jgi:hypothetical protein
VNNHYTLLKLKAVDIVDLQIIAVALQDAIVPVLDIAYDEKLKQFMFASNRFRWENKNASGDERINCAVTFSNVRRAQRKGLKRNRPSTFLNLLTINLTDQSEDKGLIIELIFSDDATIRLEIESLLCHLEDFGEPWLTEEQPQHKEE